MPCIYFTPNRRQLISNKQFPLLIFLNGFRPFNSAFFSRPREKWHMMEKMPIMIFRPEVPYDESINVVYFLGSQLSVFSRKFSKTASSAHRRKMPEINAASTDTKTLLLDIAEGCRIF